MIIRKNGIYVQPEEGVEELLTNGELSYHIGDYVTIDDDVTVEDIFNHLIIHKDINHVMASWLNGTDFSVFYDEMCKHELDKDSPYISLVFKWVANIIDYGDAEIGNEFMDYIEPSALHVDGYLHETTLMGVHTLKHCYVLMDYQWELMKGTDSIIKVVKNYRFEDVIGTLLYELSIHGHPSEREEFKDSLREFINEAELNNALDDTMEIIDLEESDDGLSSDNIKLRIEFLEKQLHQYVKVENFESASKIKKQIEKLNQRLK